MSKTQTISDCSVRPLVIVCHLVFNSTVHPDNKIFQKEYLRINVFVGPSEVHVTSGANLGRPLF